jgi:hypothetical protein
MANTWQAAGQNLAITAGKHMLDVFNAAASTRVIRIYRAYAFNNGTGAVTGVLNYLRCNITTAATAGTAVAPIAMDTTNLALNANTSVGTNRNVTVASFLRQLLQSPDEPTVSLLDWDALGTLVPFAEVWSVGYGDTNLQPVTCRPGEARGFSLQSLNQTVGVNDYEIMFTDSAT